jgi:hypothetical protein
LLFVLLGDSVDIETKHEGASRNWNVWHCDSSRRDWQGNSELPLWELWGRENGDICGFTAGYEV